MGVEIVSKLSTCISQVSQLEKQLNDNLESFQYCTKGDVYDAYKASNQAAVAQCTSLKKKLTQMKANEEAKLLTQV